jgi:hypothetical protein
MISGTKRFRPASCVHARMPRYGAAMPLNLRRREPRDDGRAARIERFRLLVLSSQGRDVFEESAVDLSALPTGLDRVRSWPVAEAAATLPRFKSQRAYKR